MFREIVFIVAFTKCPGPQSWDEMLHFDLETHVSKAICNTGPFTSGWMITTLRLNVSPTPYTAADGGRVRGGGLASRGAYRLRNPF